MADLRCPNCGDNLGKDTENQKKAYCGNCGNSFNNPRGYTDDDDDDDDDEQARSCLRLN